MSEIILNSFPSMDELKDKATLVGFIAGVVTGALITRLMIGPSDDDWEDIEEEESDDEDEDEEDEASPAARASLLSAEKLLEAYPGETCKMILVVRKDIKMGPGKVAAQCSHATLGCYKIARRYQKRLVQWWEMSGQKKITLRANSDAELDQLLTRARSLGLAGMIIRDAGHTQIPAGTRTVLGIGPGPESLVNEVTGHLKLIS
eukprot:m.27727 g.27727  ORF g.27727 m.27727 type:complete len:204 (+) comp7926_c1_seq1:216-827(+)